MAKATREDQVAFEDVRRSDRAIQDEGWFHRFLEGATSGVLAMVEDNQPHLNVNLFVYDRKRRRIYLHTAGKGATRERLKANGKVAFLVHCIGRFLPAEQAAEFSVEYASLIAYGNARIVSNLGTARKFLSMTLEKYFPHLEPGEDYRPMTDKELRRTTVIEVDIERWSGKVNRSSDEVDGAFVRNIPHQMQMFLKQNESSK